MARCDTCDKSTVEDGVALFRMNETGIDGIWRCLPCLDMTGAIPFDPESIEVLQDMGLIPPDEVRRHG